MQLHNLKPAPGSRKKRVIIGRGEGSTMGQTAGRGQKGQMSRSGESIMNGFEGGQTPLIRRIPKRGFNHASKINYVPINLGVLEAKFDAGTQITGEVLYNSGLMKSAERPFKVLGRGKISKALKITGSKISKSAEKALKDAGGSFTAAK